MVMMMTIWTVALALFLCGQQTTGQVVYYSNNSTSDTFTLPTQIGPGSMWNNLGNIIDANANNYADTANPFSEESATVTVRGWNDLELYGVQPYRDDLVVSGIQFDVLSSSEGDSGAAISLARIASVSGGRAATKFTVTPSVNIHKGFGNIPTIPLSIGSPTDTWGENWQLSDLSDLTFELRYVATELIPKVRIYSIKITVYVTLSMSLSGITPLFGYRPDGRSAAVAGPQDITVTGENFYNGFGTISCLFAGVATPVFRIDSSTLQCPTTQLPGTGAITVPFSVQIGAVQTIEQVAFEFRPSCPGDPQLCSGQGDCLNGVCACNLGRSGLDCSESSGSTSSNTGTASSSASDTTATTTSATGTVTESSTATTSTVVDERSAGEIETSSNSMGLILGIVFGIIGLLAVVVIVAIVLFRRSRRGAGGNAGKFTPANYMDSAFGKQLALQYSLAGNYVAASKGLEEILLRDGFKVAMAVVNNTAPTEADGVSRSLSFLFLGTGKILPLLLQIIDIEMQRAKNQPTTLFRGNSMATKIFQTYSRVVGLHYLWDTLGPFLVKLDSEAAAEKTVDSVSGQSSFSNTFEVDPEKVSEEQKEFLVVNKYKLMLSAQTLMVSLFKSSSALPSSIRQICSHVSQRVPENFRDTSIGALLFLRFIVPAITTPHVYGIFQQPPQSNTQRKLILLSKILQNLANGTTFGGKEEYMTKLSDLVVENQQNFHQFFTDVVNGIPSSPQREEQAPENVRTNALCLLHIQLLGIIEKIEPRLSQSEVNELKGALASLSPPTKI